MNNIRSLLLKLSSRASLPRDVTLTVIGAVLGWGISHIYYLKSVSDLKADAEEKKELKSLSFAGSRASGRLSTLATPQERSPE